MGFGYNSDKIDVLGRVIQGTMSVGNSAVEAKVGATAQAGRQEIIIFNDSQKTLYWSVNPVVTAGPAGGGFPIDPGEAIDLPFTENVPVYIIAQSGNNTIIVLEGAN